MGRRKGKALSNKTLNDYLNAASAFCVWLERRKRTEANPMDVVDRLQGDPTFVRGVFTPEQAARLLKASGDRWVLYLTALETSYRRSTLYHLTWACTQLDSDSPMIRPDVRTIKNRDEHALPLRPGLHRALLDLRPKNYEPSGRVFKDLLPTTHDVHFMKIDLNRAGLPFVDDQSQVYDFHALRHTACTWAAATGESGAVFRAMSGHKTEAAASRYLHMTAMPVDRLMSKMPDLAGTHIGTHEMRTGAGQDGTEQHKPGSRNSPESLQTKEKPALAAAKAGLTNMTPTGFEPVLLG
ncbi:MAG: tyrosine-type recombinase/integrase [Phycisphaeraceae bacterium]|nr:tyrosine-type recombinase/integrase [Phycisphaeraceae bacterium]